MRTMTRHPVSTRSDRKPVRRHIRAGIVLALFCIAMTACGTVENRRPKGTTKPLPAAQARLFFNLPALSAATVDYRRYTSADGRFVEEFGTWTAGADGSTAGLLISEAVGAAPLLDAESLEKTVDLWSELRDKNPGFGPPKQVSTATGTTTWRRASIGTRICVVFLQRFETASGGGTGTRAVLTGYFCNAIGATLDPDTAEAAVKAAGLRGPAPPQ